MRAPTATILTLLVALCAGGRAAAISTLEDTINKVPQIFRPPSTEPPNNAVHRHFHQAHPGNYNPDEGPTRPVTIPASSAPWTAAISESADLSRDYLCAGVHIDRHWVLTAAHCMFSAARRWPNDADLYVFLKTAALTSPGTRLKVQEVVPHPQYDAKTLRNDLALLRIDSTDAKVSAPIGFDGPPMSDQVGEIGTILGWGITTHVHVDQHSERLQLVQAAILDDSLCFSPANFPALRKTGVFCATSLLKHHDVCFRFGGSPMVLYDRKGRLYVGGLVSWPAVCPDDGRKPNVYLDVHFFAPWIGSVIGGKQARQLR
jgi:secreted trypsin-like serine protease